MGRKIKLEIGTSFHDYEIKAWAESNKYPMDINSGKSIINVYNGRGQYTSFEWYNSMYTCTALWFRITNPRHPYYKPLPEDEDFREIYE